MNEVNYQTTELQLKSMDEYGYFCGYASVFNVIDQQKDIIKQGAFAKSIRSPKKVKLLWQHLTEKPIGVVEELKEDSHGLYIKAKLLLDVAKGREVYALIKSGAINGLSIGYTIKDYSYDAGGVRHIKDLSLMEVSVVTFPANTSAGIIQVKGKNNIAMLSNVLDRAIEKLRDMMK